MLKQSLVRFALLTFLSLYFGCISALQVTRDEDGIQLLGDRDAQGFGGFPDLYEASIADLQKGLQKRQFTSVDLVKVSFRCGECCTRVHHSKTSSQAYLARIDEVNLKGPALRAVLEINPNALKQAKALDLERKRKGARGPLHGIPILVKDNIGTQHSEGQWLH